ncbi:hypothetical protein D3C71_53270 [compost metagenome]
MKTVKIDKTMSKHVQKKNVLFNIGLFFFLLVVIYIVSRSGHRLSIQNSMYLIFACAFLFPIIILLKMVLFKKK